MMQKKKKSPEIGVTNLSEMVNSFCEAGPLTIFIERFIIFTLALETKINHYVI